MPKHDDCYDDYNLRRDIEHLERRVDRLEEQLAGLRADFNKE